MDVPALAVCGAESDSNLDKGLPQVESLGPTQANRPPEDGIGLVLGVGLHPAFKQLDDFIRKLCVAQWTAGLEPGERPIHHAK